MWDWLLYSSMKRERVHQHFFSDVCTLLSKERIAASGVDFIYHIITSFTLATRYHFKIYYVNNVSTGSNYFVNC